MLNRALIPLFVLATLPAVGAEAAPPSKGKQWRLAVLADGPGPHARAFADLVRREILALTKGEFSVSFPAEKQVFGDRSARGIAAAGEQLLADPEVDLLITVGPLASHAVARRELLPKPVIAGHIVDPVAQGVPLRAGKSGKQNLTYVTSTLDVVRAMKSFRRVTPAKHLAMLLPKGYGASFTAVGAKIQQLLRSDGMRVTWLEVEGPAAALVRKIPGDCDGVVLLLPPGAPEMPLAELVPQLVQRRLPSFAPFDAAPVQQGVLAGLARDESRLRMARRLALDVQRILLGEDPATFPVTISFGAPVLHINMSTANAIGYEPGWDVLSEAVLVGRKRAAEGGELTLDRAIREGLQANLSLIAAHRKVEAGVHEVRQSLARWAPSVTLSASAAFIDADRASPLFGSFERTVSGSARLSQLLFAEKALAEVAIQKQLQRGREHELQQVELEIMAAVARGYVDLLKAHAAERLRKANLQVTSKHLELARARHAIGASDMADVYRWETQLANDKQAVIRAIAQRNQAEINLNGLRRRPLEQAFTVPADGLAGSRVWRPSRRIQRYVQNPWGFSTMREFMVREGLRQAPELKQLDRALAAQRRALLSSKLDFVVPSLSLSVGVDQRFYGGPAAASNPALAGLGLAAPDKTAFSAAFALNWPIFEGTAKVHRMRQVRAELARLETQRADLAQRIEQQIRAAMHQAGSSFPGIELSAAAATAAHKSLQLVTDGYARGARSIIEVIDAQGATLAADLASAMALYDFYADFIAAMRAIGNRGFFLYDERQKDSWFDRLDRFYEARAARGDARE